MWKSKIGSKDCLECNKNSVVINFKGKNVMQEFTFFKAIILKK